MREVDPSILFNALGQQGADLKDIGAAAIASGLYPDAETLAEALNGAVTGVKKTHLFLGLTGRGLVNDGVHAGVIAALQARHFAPKSA
ncbi:MAG: hypothetical protein KDJ49_04575 [Alphaproteobacteria bacterium]|nr:hypothetical protein [Alphaproteobacteria bacterium]